MTQEKPGSGADIPPAESSGGVPVAQDTLAETRERELKRLSCGEIYQKLFGENLDGSGGVAAGFIAARFSETEPAVELVEEKNSLTKRLTALVEDPADKRGPAIITRTKVAVDNALRQVLAADDPLSKVDELMSIDRIDRVEKEAFEHISVLLVYNRLLKEEKEGKGAVDWKLFYGLARTVYLRALIHIKDECERTISPGLNDQEIAKTIANIHSPITNFEVQVFGAVGEQIKTKFATKSEAAPERPDSPPKRNAEEMKSRDMIDYSTLLTLLTEMGKAPMFADGRFKLFGLDKLPPLVKEALETRVVESLLAAAAGKNEAKKGRKELLEAKKKLGGVEKTDLEVLFKVPGLEYLVGQWTRWIVFNEEIVIPAHDGLPEKNLGRIKEAQVTGALGEIRKELVRRLVAGQTGLSEENSRILLLDRRFDNVTADFLSLVSWLFVYNSDLQEFMNTKYSLSRRVGVQVPEGGSAKLKDFIGTSAATALMHPAEVGLTKYAEGRGAEDLGPLLTILTRYAPSNRCGEVVRPEVEVHLPHILAEPFLMQKVQLGEEKRPTLDLLLKGEKVPWEMLVSPQPFAAYSKHLGAANTLEESYIFGKPAARTKLEDPPLGEDTAGAREKKIEFQRVAQDEIPNIVSLVRELRGLKEDSRLDERASFLVAQIICNVSFAVFVNEAMTEVKVDAWNPKGWLFDVCKRLGLNLDFNGWGLGERRVAEPDLHDNRLK